jgi:hypothetical protein
LEDIILKRIANITSAQALDEISDAYPDAEVLSFRKIREAGSNSDFFVARLKSAVMADESDDVVLDSDDIVIEDKKHEDSEEGKMNKIIELLTDVLVELQDESPAAEEGLEDMQLEMEEMPMEGPTDPKDDPFATLPQEVNPPAGSGVMSSLVVARPANVSKKKARVELVREFSSQGYRIASIQEIDGQYVASLEKTADASRRQKDKARRERSDLAERKDKSLAPGTKKAEWQDIGYANSPTGRKRQIDALMEGLNNGQPFPEPKAPKDKSPESMRAFQQEMALWERKREQAEEQMALPQDLEDYLTAHYKAMQSDPNLNADEVIDLSNREYNKIKAMPSRADRQEYYEGQEDFLAEGIAREKKQIQREFRFPDKQLGERGQVSPEGYKELMRRGDPSVEYLNAPKEMNMSMEEIEQDLLSQITKALHKGGSDKSAYDILMDRKLAWQDPEAYAQQKFADKMDVPAFQEEAKRYVQYLQKNIEQNKRAYYDALARAAGLDPEEQANYIQNYKTYGEKGPSPLPSQVDPGIGPRMQPPGSIERQRKVWTPTPTPQEVQETGGTPRTQVEDFKEWFRSRNRVQTLRPKQQVQPEEQAPQMEEQV